MSKNISASRRSFLQGGALLAAPIAVASVSAVAFADDRLKTRMTRLEDEAAIRELHRSWVRNVNAGTRDPQLPADVRSLATHREAAAERIDIAADGRSAAARFDQMVEFETALPADSTLAQMAHAQGSGSVRCTARCTLDVTYRKSAAGWQIGTIGLERI